MTNCNVMRLKKKPKKQNQGQTLASVQENCLKEQVDKGPELKIYF